MCERGSVSFAVRVSSRLFKVFEQTTNATMFLVMTVSSFKSGSVSEKYTLRRSWDTGTYTVQ